jgi:CelD/BcsL family acetyltransferase involved in cellulose biosynthesis
MPVSNVQNWLHYHSFLGVPLVRRGAERPFWYAALRQLDGERWARGFLHLTQIAEDGPVHQGLREAAQALGRPCDIVHRTERAMLASSLGPDAYYERTVRKKKRKELKRLAARLAEQGSVVYRRFGADDDLESWCDAFLALERSGWKGRSGSALGCGDATGRFFRDVIAGAHDAGRLELLRLDLDGRPLAMLVNFLTPPGSYSFKIAFDEDYSRFSPGVLIQIENLRILEQPEIEWMDSCAVEDHPMINSLWAERRSIVRLSVPLAGPLRQATFRLCRLAEEASAANRRRRAQPAGAQEEGQDDA